MTAADFQRLRELAEAARSRSVVGAYFMVHITGRELLELLQLAQNAANAQADEHPAQTRAD